MASEAGTQRIYRKDRLNPRSRTQHRRKARRIESRRHEGKPLQKRKVVSYRGAER